VQSTSERSRAAWLDFGGDRREYQGNRVNKTRKRAAFPTVPFPELLRWRVGACLLRAGGSSTAAYLKPKVKGKNGVRRRKTSINKQEKMGFQQKSSLVLVQFLNRSICI